MSTQSQEVAQRTPQQQLAQTIEGDYFREQIAKALPTNVTVDRFTRALLTAVMQNPDVAKADHQSIILSAIRCAQDGLLPDGRQAAIAVFGGKAQYMPMIAGLRKALADYGWTMRTRAVREADDFAWTDEPQEIAHRQAPAGVIRGRLIYAYAIVTHKDGRRVQRVATVDEIYKRRDIARSKAVWEKWEDEMAEKTVGHMVFPEIPLSDLDEGRDRLARIVQAWEADPAKAVDAIYGPERETPALEAATDPPGEPGEPDASAEGAASDGGQAVSGEINPPSADGSSPDVDPGEDPSIEFGDTESALVGAEPPLKVPAAIIDQAAQTVIASHGLTIDAILEKADNDQWLLWALRGNLDLGPELSALELVIRERRPDLWAAREEVA